MRVLRSDAPALCRGRGLLVLPSADVNGVLDAAAVPVMASRAAAFRALVLGMPALERVIGGVLLDPEQVAAAGTRPWPTGANRRGLAVGVALGAGSIPPGLRDPTTYLERLLLRCVLNRASFVSFALVGGGRVAPDEFAVLARTAASWAAVSQGLGLQVVLSCPVSVAARATLPGAERLHRDTVGGVVAALREQDVDLGNVTFQVGLVLPGGRASGVPAADDVAAATMRSLRDAGVDGAAGVVVDGDGLPQHRAAQLAALGRHRPEQPLGFAADRGFLTPIAAIWRGCPDRVRPARVELLRRLSGLAAAMRAGRAEA